MIDLYLAHPFDSRKYIRKWEKGFEKRTGINLINPFYDGIRTEAERIDSGRATRYEELDAQELIQRDITKILLSKGIISIVDGNLSYGTIQEMVYAHLNNKFVFSVITNEHYNHPWLKYHSSKIFRCLKDLEKGIIKKCPYCEENKMHIVAIEKNFDMYECLCGESWMEEKWEKRT